MNYYTGADFGRSFRIVRKNTIQTAMDIPADKWGFRATPESMSVHEILAHLAASTTWRLKMHRDDRKPSLSFEDFGAYMAATTAYEKGLETRDAVLAALETDGEAFAAYLDSISDDALAETVAFPAPLDPPSKTRFEMLMGAKEHEMHHRAQLMVCQRLLGIVPHLTRIRQEQMAALSAQAPKN